MARPLVLKIGTRAIFSVFCLVDKVNNSVDSFLYDSSRWVIWELLCLPEVDDHKCHQKCRIRLICNVARSACSLKKNRMVLLDVSCICSIELCDPHGTVTEYYFSICHDDVFILFLYFWLKIRSCIISFCNLIAYLLEANKIKSIKMDRWYFMSLANSGKFLICNCSLLENVKIYLVKPPDPSGNNWLWVPNLFLSSYTVILCW